MITCERLTAEAFRPYGDVVDIRASGKHASLFATRQGGSVSSRACNQGRALRYDRLFNVQSFDRPSGSPSPLNICYFDVDGYQGEVLDVTVLERHLYSNQVFVPMQHPAQSGDVFKAAQYLVIVALNGSQDRPDLRTLKAFVADSWQAISYSPGVWHFPMMALQQAMSFLCLVHENGLPSEDTHLFDVHPPVAIGLRVKSTSKL